MQSSYAKQTVRYFWQELRRHKAYLIPVLLMLPTAIFLNDYLGAWIVAQVINMLTAQSIPPDRLWPAFAPWILAYAGRIVLGELILWRLAWLLAWRLESKVVYALNQTCLEALTARSMHFHNSRFGGSLVSQVNKYSGSYATLADTVIFNIIPLVFSFIFTFAILGPVLPAFTLVVAILSAVFLTIAWFSFSRIRNLNAEQAEAENRLSGQLADSISNIMTVKSYSGEQYEKERFAKANTDVRLKSLSVIHGIIKRDFFFGTIVVLMSIAAFITLVFGQAWFNAPIGTLILAMTLSLQILGRLWNFNGILRNINRSLGNAQEMTKILSEPPTVTDIEHAHTLDPHVRGQIEFKAIDYRHIDAKDGDDSLFKQFTLHIHAGEHVGLVGPSGSGKTTLTKLLLRFADIDAGAITVDGYDIAAVTQHSLRQAVAYVPQEPLLFHRTLGENIAYSKPGADPEEIYDAARKAHALEFIKKLPQGLDTMVGERGVKLSGGQRQRIAIARAILKDAPILILDEATSALDSESERLIQDALDELMRKRTAIVVAHRLSTVQKMDRIIVLEDGKITEQGPHEELVGNQGTYAALWSHQTGNFMDE